MDALPTAEPPLAGRRMGNVKAHNVRAVLLALLHERATSRVGIAQLTRLSGTTLTNIVDDLIGQGLVAEEGREAAPGSGAGRPPTLLRLIPSARYAVGVHIGVNTLRVGVIDLAGQIQHYHVLPLAAGTPAAQILGRIEGQVRAAITATGAAGRLVGVGVGASGLVDVASGVNVLAPSMGWQNLPLRDELERRLDLPVFVDNNVRAMALAEALFGLGRGARALAFVYGRIGVGAGLIFDGRLYRGSSSAAGEIGHMTLVPHGGAPCQCGNTGCLETLVAEPALLMQARHLAGRNPTGELARRLATTAEPNAELIIDAARGGDPDAQAILDACAANLGIALANLVNMINPDRIVLGGLFATGQDLLLPPIIATVGQRAFGNLGRAVAISATAFGPRAGVIGAGTLALDRFFYHSGGASRE